MTQALAAPARAAGVELLGPLEGSGYRQAQGLVRRADGQTVQLTPLLYALLGLLDGRRDLPGLAVALSDRLGKRVAADDVADLLGRLRPLGLLDEPGADAPPRVEPLLGLRCRVLITNPAVTRRLTAPFAQLFRPWVVLPVLAGFLAVCWFVLVEKGLASATRQAFFEPELLLAVFALTVLSAGFHEFGHAAACRYGGATPGAMGAALYLAWPAFYTDVDDSYRLSRWGRLRVDLGGLYFNALVAVAVTAAWLVWRKDALLLGVATQLLQMVRQLAPVIRADGYHVLADLTGVPDLFRHLGPTLRRLLPWHWKEPSPLSRGARWTVTCWTLVVAPLLLGLLVSAVVLLPRLVATAWAAGQVQAGRLSLSDPVTSGAALLRLLALVVPVLAVSLLVGQLVRRLLRWVAARTEGRPRLRAAAVVAGLVVLLLLLQAWWPSGQYREVHARERGTLSSLLGGDEPAAATLTAPPDRTVALALVPRAPDRPALLLLPGADDRVQAVLTTVPAEDGAATAGQAFPFRLPDVPRPGDNQALAVGDADGATVYDVAYALVTVTDGATVDQRNQAYALASCTACTTVAVAFQVVLVVGRADVVAPVNTAVAANAGCVACVTAALAVQLVVTLAELPSAEVQEDLLQALARLDGLEGLDLAELWQVVQEVKAEVVQVLSDSGLLEGLVATTASATPAASPEATSSAAASAPPSSAPAGTQGPSAAPTPGPTQDVSAAPSPQATATAEPTSTPQPTTTP